MRQTPEEKAVSVSLPLLPLEGRGPALTSDGKNLYKGLLYKPVKNLLKAKAYIFISEYCVLLFEYRKQWGHKNTLVSRPPIFPAHPSQYLP